MLAVRQERSTLTPPPAAQNSPARTTAETPIVPLPPDRPTEPEAPILLALDEGDRDRALVAIDRLYGNRIYRFIRGITASDALADDVYQSTLIQTHRDLARFARRSSVKAWVFTIARNRCLDALKSQRRRARRTALGTEGTEEYADTAPGAAQRIDQAQLVAALEHCIDELAPNTRMAVLLRFQESMSYDRISAICRAKPATIRVWVSRALPVLRACIERRGHL